MVSFINSLALFASCASAAAIAERQAPSGVPSYVLDYGKLTGLRLQAIDLTAS